MNLNALFEVPVFELDLTSLSSISTYCHYFGQMPSENSGTVARLLKRPEENVSLITYIIIKLIT